VRKDGSGKVARVRHEIAPHPGRAVWEEYHEPKDGKVTLDGENIVAVPKLADFQPNTLKLLRWAQRDKRLVIKERQIIL
jgi:hypothetical protein